jgi:hypothetical protein
MNRKKAKEREERKREACVLDGRDMLRGRRVEQRRAFNPIFFIFEKATSSKMPRITKTEQRHHFPHHPYTTTQKIKIYCVRVIITEVRNSS